MKRYLKNWGFLAGSDMVSQVFGFITVIQLAKILSPGNYGVYTLIISLSSIFAIVANFGMTQVIIRTIARSAPLTQKFLKAILPLRLLAILLSLVVSVIYFFIIKDVKVLVITCVAVLIVASSVWDLVESISFGKKITRFTSMVNIIFTIIWAMCIFFTPVRFFTIGNVLVAYCFINSLKSLMVTLVSYRNGVFSNIGEESAITEVDFTRGSIVKESLPYLWLWGVSTFSYLFPIVLLSRNSGVEQVGYYSIGAKLIIPFSMLIETVFKAIFPFLAELYVSSKAKFSDLVIRIFTLIIIGGACFAFIATMVSGSIIPMILGKQYLNSIPSFNYLIWSAVIYSMHVLTGNALSAAGKQGVLAKLATVDTIICLPIMFWGSYHGASGLAIARLVYLIVTMLYHWIILFGLITLNSSKMGIINIYGFLILCFVIGNFFDLNIVLKSTLFVLLVTSYYFIKSSPVKLIIVQTRLLLSKQVDKL